MIYFRDRLYLFEDEENQVDKDTLENNLKNIIIDASNSGAEDLLSFIANDNTNTTDSSTIDSSTTNRDTSTTDKSAEQVKGNASETAKASGQQSKETSKTEEPQKIEETPDSSSTTTSESLIFYKNN